MRTVFGFLLCAGVILVLVIALLLPSESGVPRAEVLTALLLVGAALPLAGVVWSAAFRRR